MEKYLNIVYISYFFDIVTIDKYYNTIGRYYNIVLLRPYSNHG